MIDHKKVEIRKQIPQESHFLQVDYFERKLNILLMKNRDINALS